MDLHRLFHRRDNRPTHPPRASRRPLVEVLEGRRLLTPFTKSLPPGGAASYPHPCNPYKPRYTYFRSLRAASLTG
jgi:hypothetical protein